METYYIELINSKSYLAKIDSNEPDVLIDCCEIQSIMTQRGLSMQPVPLSTKIDTTRIKIKPEHILIKEIMTEVLNAQYKQTLQICNAQGIKTEEGNIVVPNQKSIIIPKK